ncbi:hypothetical protein MVLG_06936 [Microbotryum lychnidis-dioicae p1A1 Lamole]|uniref:Translation initiation factor 5A C-terminal domain-containing protein n=1 Tax=Microbotryum lychnidis-dioicae (strain p1A1 Lamole / MvSl-1064) TaxID=683840 RepID=U5HIT8_USTV1|nr:hypothetical protein MVLG_06936 [Microbotryum lychnidis-dioicae p1A1 Lamole]|eukprot:KDE02518.1 hypothetical protein MVLG_06936 [Microbotryum lychnidis-dioicae p1A1 Lamole]
MMSDTEQTRDQEHEETTFESANAGASLTYPMQCSALRKGGYVVMKSKACKIIDMSTSKTGKHGHAKVHLIATDIFTGKKLEDISPSTHNMDVPNVIRSEYQLINIDDGFLNLMTTDGTAKDDVRLPESEIGDQIQAAFDDGTDVSDKQAMDRRLIACRVSILTLSRLVTSYQLLVTIIAAMGQEQAIAFKEAPKVPLLPGSADLKQ